ncbi:MAG: EamA family transporter [Candidatus Omnitrophota bacterium]
MSAFLWSILAAVIWGLVPILEKAGLVNVRPLAGLFYRCFGVVIGVILLGLFMVKPEDIRAVEVRSVVLLILSGFLASFVAQICFYNGLKLGDVSKVVPISGSYPLIAFLLGVLFLGESLSVWKIAGAVLVIAGIWLLKIG